MQMFGRYAFDEQQTDRQSLYKTTIYNNHSSFSLYLFVARQRHYLSAEHEFLCCFVLTYKIRQMLTFSRGLIIFSTLAVTSALFSIDMQREARKELTV